TRAARAASDSPGVELGDSRAGRSHPYFEAGSRRRIISSTHLNSTAEAPPPSKFTVLLDHDAAADFDQLALDIRRLIGRRVSKGHLVRALLALATAEPALRDQLVNELRAHPAV
ncbi:MAG: hypothetical protein ACRDRY_21750, partial [Pseudonocardiaceae bacterium]